MKDFPDDIHVGYIEQVESLIPLEADTGFERDLNRIIRGLFEQHFRQIKINVARKLQEKDLTISRLRQQIQNLQNAKAELRAKKKVQGADH